VEKFTSRKKAHPARKEMTIKHCERVAQREMEQKQNACSTRGWAVKVGWGNGEKGAAAGKNKHKNNTHSAATTLAIKAAYGFYDSINLKCSMPNNKIPLSSLRPNYLAEMSRSQELSRYRECISRYI